MEGNPAMETRGLGCHSFPISLIVFMKIQASLWTLFLAK